MNIREYRRGNIKWTTQKNCTRHKRKTNKTKNDISIQYFSEKKYMKQSKLLYYIKSERIIHNNVNITNGNQIINFTNLNLCLVVLKEKNILDTKLLKFKMFNNHDSSCEKIEYSKCISKLFYLIKKLHKTQEEDKQNKKHYTICVGHHYVQTNTNNINKTWILLQTGGGILFVFILCLLFYVLFVFILCLLFYVLVVFILCLLFYVLFVFIQNIEQETQNGE
jgi:hypothetical protein